MCATERAPARVPMQSDLLRTTMVVMSYSALSGVLASHHGWLSASVMHIDSYASLSVRHLPAAKETSGRAEEEYWEDCLAFAIAIILFGSGTNGLVTEM